MKKYWRLFYLIFSSELIIAQNYVDILKLNLSTTPYNKFDTSSSKTKINQLDADVTIPIKLNSKLTLLSGFLYENFQTKLFADGPVKNFGSIALKLGLNKTFNEHWIGTMVLLPKIASDFVSRSSNDFQYGVVALMKYKKADHLNYKFGMYYNSELFGPFFVPMVGLYFLSENKKFEANIMLPLNADANYKLTKFLNAGINFNGQIRSYHLNHVTPSLPHTYVARSTNEFYAYLRFNFSESMMLQTKCGISVARNFRVYEENDKVNFGLPATFIGQKRQQLNSDFSNGLIFQASFIYRVNFNKNK